MWPKKCYFSNTPEFIYFYFYSRCGHTCIELEEMLNRDICEQRTSEFKTLATLRHNYTIGDCAAGHRAENRDKNRNVLGMISHKK